MKKRPYVALTGGTVRSTEWNGLRAGDDIVVNLPKELKMSWVFIAHVLNTATGDEWVEVRGGRNGETKGRSFRPELIYPRTAKKGSKIVGPSIAQAPRLSL